MTKIRILVCGSDNGLGGGQVAYRRFVEFLSRENNIVVGAISIGGPYLEDRSVALEKFTLVRIEPGKKLFQKSVSLGIALRQARSFKPDIFVTIGLSRSANAIMKALSSTVRGLAFDFIGDRLPSDRLLASSFKTFRNVCVQSPSMVTRLVEAGHPASQLDCAPCFSGLDYPDLAKRGISNISETFNIAYFGRLAPNKGLPVYIEALANLQEFAFHFDIWGTGPEADMISKFTDKYGLVDRIVLKGRYPAGREATKLMSSYDAVVMPSQRLEGVPLVLIEAMAVGVPAICTDVGAMKDVCHDNPDFIMSAPDASSLAQATKRMRLALKKHEINHSRLRSNFEARFSDQAVASIWRSRIEALMESKGIC